MAGWFKALKKTRDVFSSAISSVLNVGQKVDEDTLEELEEALLRADMNPRLAAEIIMELEKAARKADSAPREVLKALLRSRLADGFDDPFSVLPPKSAVMMVGINGAGKTTTCAKLAHKAVKDGHSVLLGAADTFRAAGTEQVRIWGERLGVPVVAGKQGADAAAVAYDATDAARARDVDFLFIDTAGRMHTKSHLMDELSKMVRAMKKRDENAPQGVWMILDSSLGQNALHQARLFHESVALTGLILTKLDGSSKAGFLFSIRQELPDVPILFAGLGEQEDDLVPFDPDAFVESLVDGSEMSVSSHG